MLITKSKFGKYQSMFFDKLQKTPHKIQLEVVEVQKPTDEDEFSFEAFVGDSTRSSKMYEFNALYEAEISDRMREKYGLPQEVNGIVYLSPKQLMQKLGYYRLDWNKTKVHFRGRVQVISKIVYLEELYDSCVAVQIFVKDALKGG